MRNEEATMRPWEKQWNGVTHGKTVSAERSAVSAIVSATVSGLYYIFISFEIGTYNRTSFIT